jgi:methylglutamate dehydrogenase subunit D
MPEFRSALAGQPPFRASIAELDLVIDEVTGRDLLQLAGWPDSFEAAQARLARLCGCPEPRDTRSASTSGATTLFRIGPDRVWLVAPVERNLGPQLDATFTANEAVVTELGHSRTIIRVGGRVATDLLARLIAIDLDDREFPTGHFAQTPLLHTGVLVHRAAFNDFDVYVPRSYALSIWESMTAAADLLPIATVSVSLA